MDATEHADVGAPGACPGALTVSDQPEPLLETRHACERIEHTLGPNKGWEQLPQSEKGEGRPK